MERPGDLEAASLAAAQALNARAQLDQSQAELFGLQAALRSKEAAVAAMALGITQAREGAPFFLARHLGCVTPYMLGPSEGIGGLV